VVRYRGIFSNTQVDYTDNSPNEQDVYVLITDATQLYNMAYTEVAVGGGNTEYTFTFSGLPATAAALVFSYTNDGGVTWANYGPVAPTSPVVFELPNTADRQFIVYVQRTDGSDTIDMTEITTVDFELSGIPTVQRVVDNDEDKYTPIRSKQMEIQAHTSDEFSILNFKDGTDNQFKVEIAIGTETDIMFTGWLSVSDLRQRFQPHPNVLVLTATDGLGFLKDIDLTDISGEQFTDENKIIEYIAACLYGTGLELPIEVEMNIMESTAPLAPSGHMYNFCFLHALTFETNIGEFDDCYTVLEKILGENSYLTQEKNRWYIKRVDEYDNHNPVSVTFAYDGSTVDASYFELYKKEIGSNSLLYSLAWMNEDAELSLLSAHKEVKHVYNYNNFQEIPCNKTFIRGDYVEDIDSTRKKYALSCWDFLKQTTPPTDPTAATDGDAYVIREFDAYERETDRYLVMTYPAYPNPNKVESQRIPVDEGDKIGFGFTYRFSSDIDDGIFANLHSQVRLEADNGDFYFLDDDGKWYLSDSTWSTNYKFLQSSIDTDVENMAEWITYDIESIDPIPVNGKIVLLINWGNYSQLASRELHVKDVQFTYIPRINGSYRSYAGHYYKSSQDNKSLFKREEEVFISDIAKRLHKGCILKADGDNFVICEGFFNYAVFPSGPPSAEYIHPFGAIQNWDVWNQYNRTFAMFEGTIDGLDTDKQDGAGLPDVPGFIHTYYLKDSHELTNNKKFMPLHFEQDFYMCEWDVVLVEVFDTTIDKNYLGQEFKYIESDT